MGEAIHGRGLDTAEIDATRARRPACVVRAAQAGDEDAFRTLYRRLTPDLVRYARILVPDGGRPAAERLVAATWAGLSAELVRFRGGEEDFRRFALASLRNRARGSRRRRHRRPAEVSPPTGPARVPSAAPSSVVRAPDAADSRPSTRRVFAALAALPRPQAEAILLRLVLDLDARGAAQVLGRRPGAVSAALARGLRRLARQYDGGERIDAQGD
ncbi:sigma-70 family RNA polymerase sigma factor [Streptomyces sp. OF3]|uniref:Sigma-70 family RNA polymerase sigma factor n=1 Tax=Streptomyces alkaliterrae TaxID=2213162 RepID=A0A7W3WMT4_9ACTN|nr:sigma-70 family RNA polymerase sigma factor [Streptomyces alkaliterrae]MBB1255226.1 sigma-70 family RNA polymerase sigma factor [Streptomyces alkaliterrae]